MLESMLAAERRFYERNETRASELAATAAELGDKSQAIAYLKISLARHEDSNITVAISREFSSLHNNAAFRELSQQALPRPR